MLPNLFTWMPLPDLPKVPDRFIQRGLELIEDGTGVDQNISLKMLDNSHYDRRLIKNGQEMPTRKQVNYNIGAEWDSWVREHIFPTFEETGIRFSSGSATHTGPHVDNPGKIRFFYLIDRGGEDTETVFYLEPGKTPIFDMDNWNQAKPYTYNNIDELIVLDRARFPLNTWVLFNGYILHGVENVTAPRIFLSVSIRPEDFIFHIKPAG